MKERPCIYLALACRSKLTDLCSLSLSLLLLFPTHRFTVKYTVDSLLAVLDGLQPEDSGGFFAFDGSKIEF